MKNKEADFGPPLILSLDDKIKKRLYRRFFYSLI